MSIAANAHWTFIKLRRSGMFIRRFMEIFGVGHIFDLRTSNFELPLIPASPSFE
jgi:hypothetical protein